VGIGFPSYHWVHWVCDGRIGRENVWRLTFCFRLHLLLYPSFVYYLALRLIVVDFNKGENKAASLCLVPPGTGSKPWAILSRFPFITGN
jgi:hypothetical protein